jgi:hypothetical protein
MDAQRNLLFRGNYVTGTRCDVVTNSTLEVNSAERYFVNFSKEGLLDILKTATIRTSFPWGKDSDCCFTASKVLRVILLADNTREPEPSNGHWPRVTDVLNNLPQLAWQRSLQRRSCSHFLTLCKNTFVLLYALGDSSFKLNQ